MFLLSSAASKAVHQDLVPCVQRCPSVVVRACSGNDISGDILALGLDQGRREVLWVLARNHCFDSTNCDSHLVGDHPNCLASFLWGEVLERWLTF